jgi:hypothetical protein
MANLLIALLCCLSVAGCGYGITVLTDLSFIAGLPPSVLLCMTKLYFLRYQPAVEQAINSGWDRVVGYLIAAFFSVCLTAFGLYSLSADRQVVTKPLAQLEDGDEKITIKPVEEQSNDAWDSDPGDFLTDTFEQNHKALGCWIAPSILEVLILLLMLHNRPRYHPYHFIE